MPDQPADEQPGTSPSDGVTVSVAVQMEPVGRYGNPQGDPFASMTIEQYAEMVTRYFADNVLTWAESRGADAFVAVSVVRGDQKAGHEFRSGHYVKDDNDA